MLLPVAENKQGVTHLKVQGWYSKDAKPRGYYANCHMASKDSWGSLGVFLQGGGRVLLETMARDNLKVVSRLNEEVRTQVANQSGAVWDMILRVAERNGLALQDDSAANPPDHQAQTPDNLLAQV